MQSTPTLIFFFPEYDIDIRWANDETPLKNAAKKNYPGFSTAYVPRFEMQQNNSSSVTGDTVTFDPFEPTPWTTCMKVSSHSMAFW